MKLTAVFVFGLIASLMAGVSADINLNPVIDYIIGKEKALIDHRDYFDARGLGLPPHDKASVGLLSTIKRTADAYVNTAVSPNQLVLSVGFGRLDVLFERVKVKIITTLSLNLKITVPTNNFTVVVSLLKSPNCQVDLKSFTVDSLDWWYVDVQGAGIWSHLVKSRIYKILGPKWGSIKSQIQSTVVSLIEKKIKESKLC